jgi:hypothetical protein
MLNAEYSEGQVGVGNMQPNMVRGMGGNRFQSGARWPWPLMLLDEKCLWAITASSSRNMVPWQQWRRLAHHEMVHRASMCSGIACLGHQCIRWGCHSPDLMFADVCYLHNCCFFLHNQKDSPQLLPASLFASSILTTILSPAKVRIPVYYGNSKSNWEFPSLSLFLEQATQLVRH